MPTKLLVRLPGVTLAAISLLLLSVPAFGLHFKDTFMVALSYMGDLISGVLQLDLIEAAIRKALAPYDIDFHPAKYWHHSFVLLWLAHSSVARNVRWGWSGFLFLMFTGGVTALVAGVATGLAPLDSVALFAWPLAGFATFLASYLAWYSPSMKPSKAPIPLLIFSLIAAYVGYAYTTPLPQIIGLNVPSPGLAGLAILVFIFGVFSVLFGIWVLSGVIGAPFSKLVVDDPYILNGLDILGTLGLAAALAIAAHYLL